jgi:hypothetical protein
MEGTAQHLLSQIYIEVRNGAPQLTETGWIYVARVPLF